MKYISQLNAFWRWRELHELTHAEADLYLSILSIWNDFQRKPSLGIPAKALICRADLSDKSQLRKLRKSLIEKGLITYSEGKSGQAGTYNVTKLYDDTSDCTPVLTETEPRIVHETNPDLYPDLYPINKSNEKEKELETEIYTEERMPQKSCTPDEIMRLYNSVCKSLPQVTKLTQHRADGVTARLKEYSREQIEEAFKKAEASDFLAGRSGGWKASFDWLFSKEGNILKVIEGNYDNDKYPRSGSNLYPDLYPPLDPTENTDEIQKRFAEVYNGI